VEELKAHRSSSHAAAVRKLRCSYCDFVAGSSGSLRMHENRKHLNLFCLSCKEKRPSEVFLIFCIKNNVHVPYVTCTQWWGSYFNKEAALLYNAVTSKRNSLLLIRYSIFTVTFLLQLLFTAILNRIKSYYLLRKLTDCIVEPLLRNILSVLGIAMSKRSASSDIVQFL
jgi:hypothetical protein